MVQRDVAEGAPGAAVEGYQEGAFGEESGAGGGLAEGVLEGE